MLSRTSYGAIARPLLLAVCAVFGLGVACLPAAAAPRGGSVVNLVHVPSVQAVPVGAIVNVKIAVSSPGVGGQPFDALDAVVVWDPTKLTLVGSTQVGAGAAFFLTGFLPDPDGVNANLTDGNAIFTALGLPGSQVIAPQVPGQTIVTTLQFLALTPTPATLVDFLPTIGLFGKTRVLLAGFEVTGDASSVATVTIVGSCPPSGHDCFTTGTPGCSDSTCCEAVCEIDPACCGLAWDATCVGEAGSLCDGCGDPTAAACCVVHASPYCNDSACCEAVCVLDPFCCDVGWDASCVAAALAAPSCGCDPCSVSVESCFAEHAGPGCEDQSCCTVVCGSDPSCCEIAWDTGCKDAANVACGGCGGFGAGSCYCPHPSVGCNDAGCCRDVCEADPTCCADAWDAVCATQAESICGCIFDADVNGVVDAADLAVFLGAWGTNICPFDADHSGVVDGADLAILLGAWGNCP